MPGKKTNVIREREGVLSAEKLQPGQKVFIDHFISSIRGRKLQGCGVINPKTKREVKGKDKSYCGGCMFVDAASGYVQVQFQSYLSAVATVEAVENYEKHALDNGVIVSQYYFCTMYS